MLYVGLRRGEVLGLRWRSVHLADPDGARLEVRETIVRGRAESPKSERGERTISVERFCDLCDVYQVSPQAILGDIVRAVAGTTEPQIDLTRIEEMGTVELTLVAGFVRQIRAQRHEAPSEMIVLREADLDVLATAAGKTREELAEALEPTIRRTGERPN